MCEVPVGGNVQIHAHGRHEGGEVVPGQIVAPHRVRQGPQDGFTRFAAGEDAVEVGVDRVETGSLVPGGQLRTGLVDDVVHPACEAVQGVDTGSALRRQNTCGGVVGTAVVSVQGPAEQVVLPQLAGTDPGRLEFGGGGAHRSTPLPVRETTRAAASLPESRTVGNPTPGVVPQPASTAFAVPGTVLRGRNGPVCVKVCASEKGVPWPGPYGPSPLG